MYCIKPELYWSLFRDCLNLKEERGYICEDKLTFYIKQK